MKEFLINIVKASIIITILGLVSSLLGVFFAKWLLYLNSLV